jgi:aminopeptidase N
MRIAIETPPGLYCVANGELRGIVYLTDGFRRYDWHVSYPINSYNVTLNIADYTPFSEVYESRTEGLLQLDYYVLKGNEAAAKEHFKQVKTMLRCFEERLGPYPFWRDGYALVETPYWGMEHQGAIAYGNKYKNNAFGFDFIIIHESGHEWFGNLISAADHADLWIHEAFCTYTEFLYLECSTGYDRALEYLNNQRNYVRSTDAVLGPLNVNFNDWDNSDMYYKGTWLIHTLRRAMADDTRFLKAMREMGNHFGLKPTNTDAIVQYWNQATGRDWTPVFAQYLCQVDLPVLQYTFERDAQVPGMFRFNYRWQCAEERFNLPVKARVGGEAHTLAATTSWQSLPGKYASPVPVTFTESDFLGKVEFIPLAPTNPAKPKRPKSARH